MGVGRKPWKKKSNPPHIFGRLSFKFYRIFPLRQSFKRVKGSNRSTSIPHSFISSWDLDFSSLISVDQLKASTQWLNYFCQVFDNKANEVYCCYSKILSFKSLIYVEWLYQIVVNYALAGTGIVIALKHIREKTLRHFRQAQLTVWVVFSFIYVERLLEQNKYVGNAKMQLNWDLRSSVSLEKNNLLPTFQMAIRRSWIVSEWLDALLFVVI